ncbi:MAG: hypothetical protein LAO77_26260 [Acidobacteriia bacterium]|nr:hypothetical protein [Terriglobia bacterium]
MVIWIRRAFGWWTIGPAVATLVALVAIALRFSAPPAGEIALTSLGGLALLLVVKLAVRTIVSPEAFGREERMFTFVMLLTIGMGWYATRQWIFERQFDRLVTEQQTQLKLGVVELSGHILNFLEARRREAPPPPQPATWDRDELAILRFDADTGRRFDARFGAQVLTARNLLAMRGLIDRDLDRFYRHPGDAFHIRIVATRLRALGDRVP